MKNILLLAVVFLGSASVFAQNGTNANTPLESGKSLHVCIANGYACWDDACWLNDRYQAQSEVSQKDALISAIKLCYDAKNSYCEKFRCQKF